MLWCSFIAWVDYAKYACRINNTSTLWDILQTIYAFCVFKCFCLTHDAGHSIQIWEQMKFEVTNKIVCIINLMKFQKHGILHSCTRSNFD